MKKLIFALILCSCDDGTRRIRIVDSRPFSEREQVWVEDCVSRGLGSGHSVTQAIKICKKAAIELRKQPQKKS